MASQLQCRNSSPRRGIETQKRLLREDDYGLPQTPGELLRDVVPDVVRPAFKHASARHDVQTVSRRVRVGPEQRWPVDREEVDIRILARLQDRLR